MKPFSKLKKVIDGLFDPKLKMHFCCYSYPVRSACGSSSIPRFCLKMDKEVIWDFPKDFEIKKEQFYSWYEYNHLSELVRDYIDSPIDSLLQKEFKNDKVEFPSYTHVFPEGSVTIDYKLAELFKTADRRLGKEKLLNWAKTKNNPKVHNILNKRFN
jgi:hypothetical protein